MHIGNNSVKKCEFDFEDMIVCRINGTRLDCNKFERTALKFSHVLLVL